ncbi:NAD(P)/FAD-dependent oxidoreductase [Actinomadura sp. KC216]|uniref:NAD(P)/FAD-dependent oxidoreductase n=1 Tax=Actinomadura sp. KC216 TaxID=2530370 RepID=UPI001FB7621C|nr:NAD(P)/FAD-dependent oxidoreductase [Actinomadura sp. KC216]
MIESRTRHEYDVTVIGGGPGGLSAALVLARSCRAVTVINSGVPRNSPSPHMHAYLTRDGMTPDALIETGRAEAAQHGARFLDAHVQDIEPLTARSDDVPGVHPGFALHLDGGVTVTTRRVILATGLRDELPDIPGLRQRWGKDVLFCPYCHGYEVRDRQLAVLGTHTSSVDQALLVRQWSKDIIYLPHADPITDEQHRTLRARGIHVADGLVKRLVAEGDRVQGIELDDGTSVPCDAVFVFPHMVPNDGLPERLGCERNAQGWVVTEPSQKTTRDGVYAVGNLVDPRAQAIVAAGHGATAAFHLNHELVDEDTAIDLHRHATHTSANADR